MPEGYNSALTQLQDLQLLSPPTHVQQGEWHRRSMCSQSTCWSDAVYRISPMTQERLQAYDVIG